MREDRNSMPKKSKVDDNVGKQLFVDADHLSNPRETRKPSNRKTILKREALCKDHAVPDGLAEPEREKRNAELRNYAPKLISHIPSKSMQNRQISTPDRTLQRVKHHYP